MRSRCCAKFTQALREIRLRRACAVPAVAVAAHRRFFNAGIVLDATLESDFGAPGWFATTPAAVELKNGTVIRVAADMAVMNLHWLK